MNRETKKPILLADVKHALQDARFRDRMPPELLPDLQKFLGNPGCACNVSFYRKVLMTCPDLLMEYFPGQVYEEIKLPKPQPRNCWTVINCKVDELEGKLRALPPGRKQLAVARYEDMITVVVNEPDVLS